ncbi:MAG: HEAT repeat domain-containing protein, partial [Myxococcales bacterium]
RSIALALALSLIACKSGDASDPQTWIGKLGDKDAKVRVQAIQQLRKLEAKQAAPQIAELLKDPLVKEDAALALEDLGGPEQVDALLGAVETTVGAGSDTAARAANRSNTRIAEALGNIGDARAAPALLRLARASDDNLRLAAVEALGNVKAKEAVPELSHIVDDASAPPLLIKRAVVALGQIGDPAAIPALAHALVIERQGVSFLPESSFALFVIGEPAVEPLMRIAQDQDPAWLAWAKENNRAPAGTYAKTALVLGDLEDKRAIPVLVAKLKYVDPDPVPGTSRLLSNLVRMFAANALGRMRATQAAPAVQALVTTANAQDEEVTTFAAEALVWIGDRAQARELMKKAQAGLLKLRLTVAQSAALFGEPALGKDILGIAMLEAKGSPQTCLRQLTEMTLPVDDPRQACDLLATQFGELSKPLESARVCAADVPCWLPRLKDPDPVVRARAAYELGSAGAAEAVPSLAAALSEEQALVRAAATRALDWLASVPAARAALKGIVPQLAAQLAREQGKPQYTKANEELRRLHLKLSRL